MAIVRPLALAAAAFALLIAQPACAEAPIKPADATALAQRFLASLQARDASNLAALMDVPFRQLGAVVALPGQGAGTTCATEAKDAVAKQKLAACIAQDGVSAHVLANPIPGKWSIVNASEEAAWSRQRLGADLGSVGSDVVIARFDKDTGDRAQYFVGIGRGASGLVVKHFAVTWMPALF
jgi:hypothetical protein